MQSTPKRSRRFGIAMALVAFSCTPFAGCSTSAPDVPTALQQRSTLRPTLEYLADDAREGRGIGTSGLNASARVIADQFAALPLRTLPGLYGYFQPFEMNAGIAPAPSTFLRSGDETLKIGT